MTLGKEGSRNVQASQGSDVGSIPIGRSIDPRNLPVSSWRQMHDFFTFSVWRLLALLPFLRRLQRMSHSRIVGALYL
jgi:hypothetical protein